MNSLTRSKAPSFEVAPGVPTYSGEEQCAACDKRSGEVLYRDEPYCIRCAEKVLGFSLGVTAENVPFDQAEVSPMTSREIILPDKKSEQAAFALERGYHPTKEIVVQGETFFISPVVDGGRKQAVLYTEQEGVLKARLAYKSNSEGNWHVPDVVIGEKGIAAIKYGKGRRKSELSLTSPEEFHQNYTKQRAAAQNGKKVRDASILYGQQTRLVDELQLALDQQETAVTSKKTTGPAKLFAINNETREGYAEYLTQRADFASESEIIEAPRTLFGDVADLQPGAYVDESGNGRSVHEIIKNAPLPIGLASALKHEPAHSSSTEHTLLGSVTIDHYLVKTEGIGLIEWQFAADKQGRVWIQSIKPLEHKTNSFGVPDKMVDFGILLSKPLDYSEQSLPLRREQLATAFDETYDDVTPMLDELPIVQAYRYARSVVRRTGQTSSGGAVAEPKAASKSPWGRQPVAA